MKLATLLCSLLALVMVGCASRPPIVVTASMPLRQLRLDNGLVVVMNPDRTAPSAIVHMRYHVGAKDDPVGRAGLAHLVERLTFGTASQSSSMDRYTSLERLGAVEIDGATSLDHTDFVETLPASMLGRVLEIEASRMAHPIDGIDEQVVRRELAMVDNELRTRASADPYRRSTELLTEVLFGTTHPYGRTANAMRGELASVAPAELSAFAAAHYQPANATLVVSGSFEVEKAVELVKHAFSRLAGHTAPPRDVLPVARVSKDTWATFAAPVRARTVAVGWLAPPREADGYDEMMLGALAMGASLRSVLLRELGLVDDVQVRVLDGHLGSMLVVTARLRGEASTTRTVTEIERVMSFMGSLGRTFEWERFDEVGLERATTLLMGLELPSTRTAGIQDALEYGGVARSMAEEVARVQRLRPWDVGGAIEQFVVRDHHAVIVLKPDAAAPPGGVAR